MPDQNNQKKALMFLGIAAGAYFLYRIFSKEDTPKEAAIETVKAPVKIIETTAKAVKKLVKGSPEAKAHMKKLAAMRKHVGRKKGSGHKGHATKRGLAQDQKMISTEKWEKKYQDSKRK